MTAELSRKYGLDQDIRGAAHPGYQGPTEQRLAVSALSDSVAPDMVASTELPTIQTVPDRVLPGQLSVANGTRKNVTVERITLPEGGPL